jgi:hypothetical protein
MVVDALDLCYTKSHVDTFVIISGDSDFSPLVSKLRENDKVVIGVGVKSATSDLLINNCDEFIFYDDLVREKESKQRGQRKRAAKKAGGKTKQTTQEEQKKQEAFDLVLETTDALFSERGDQDKTWGSMVKQTLKRRKPGFNESSYGFRSFNKLLEEAAAHSCWSSSAMSAPAAISFAAIRTRTRSHLKNYCAWHNFVARRLEILMYCRVHSGSEPPRAAFCLRSRRF